MDNVSDCRSEDGVTIGLIDAMISIARILVNRDVTGKEVKEALLDFADDEDIARILLVAKLYQEKVDRESW